MFENKRRTDLEGEYIVDFVNNSSLVRAVLIRTSIGIIAHVYLNNDGDFGTDPFFAPINEFLAARQLPRLSLMHMHYEG